MSKTIGYLTFWVKNGFQISQEEKAEELFKMVVTNWSTLIHGVKI